MKFLATIIAVAGLLHSVSAAATAVPKRFHLKTLLKDGQTKKSYDGLYLQTAHIGAGFNAAVLTKYKKELPIQSLNATSGEVMFIIGGQKRYPGRLLLLQPYDTESGWAPSQINTVTDGTKGFELTPGGKLINKKFSSEFGGWRACRWNHYDAVELFHDIKGLAYGVPSSCALVDLVAEAI